MPEQMSRKCVSMVLDNQARPQSAAGRTELIEQLLDIGAALSSSSDLGELLNLILSKSREITCSDAGSVYLVDSSDGYPKLLFKVAQNASRPNVSFREFAIPLTRQSLAGYVALTGESLNLSDAYALPSGVPYQLDRSFDRDIDYHTRSVLVLPMQNRQGEIVGVVQLINRKVAPDVAVTAENVRELTQPYSEWEERIVRSLASQAAISIERNQLQENIKQLFEGFVKASVQVIEARDPCTSGHSERVAALTVRLCEEINSATAGPLGAVNFSDRQMQEIRYAAMLHDFGKVGVPEAILVKEKKLYPSQLEVIRHRFALVRRTLELECAQAKLRYWLEHPAHRPDASDSGCPCQAQMEQLDAGLQKTVEELDYYWNLLVEANEPSILAEKPLAKIKELCRYTYRDVDGQTKPLISSGEMAQLMVLKGTLTDEERSAIESHVSHTYEFLKRIPWTKDLQDIPEIAYGHHEKLDGTGYPRQLQQSEIPLQTQVITIADIYDALTAGDRPYKRGLPVREALDILRQEAASHKINPEFLELFERRQVFSVLGHTLEVELSGGVG